MIKGCVGCALRLHQTAEGKDPFFAKKAGCSEKNSPKVGMLLLVIELIPLELISMSPQGIVYDHMDGEV